MTNDILSVIQNGMSGFSKGQKLIANYILNSYDKAAFMTASKLGKTVNVSESTVVRFAVEIGYNGYPAMQKALQEMIRNRLTSVQRIEVANDQFENHEILPMVIQADIDMLRTTLDNIDRNVFYQCVDAILSARKIYLFGVRSSAPIASFLSYYLNLMFDNVVHIQTATTAEVYEQMIRIGEGDVLIGISFPRYSSRTVKAMKFAYDRGARTIALTDSVTAPIAKHATYTLIAKSDMVSLVDSLVAPLSIVNALIVACGYQKEDEVSRTFADLEKIWDEYSVYEKVQESV